MFGKQWREDTNAVSRTVAVAAVVAIVAVAAVVGYILLGGGSQSDGGNHTLSDMGAGDYLKYESTATNGQSVLNYVYWINVTDVGATSFTIHTTTCLNGAWYMEYNQTVDKDKAYSAIATMSGTRIDMGDTNLDTVFGSRHVEHYQVTEMGETMDFYMGISNGVLYKYTWTLAPTTGETYLVASSLTWV